MSGSNRASLVLISILCVSVPAMAGTSNAAPKSLIRHPVRKSEWPDAKVGQMARGWVEAFALGDSAMRALDMKALSKESLAKRGVEERIVSYRKLHERFGKLTLVTVVEQAPEELTASLLDSDLAAHEFTFEIEPAEPYRLASVSMKEVVHGHGGFGGFHH